jgi:hypothetical protein
MTTTTTKTLFEVTCTVESSRPGAYQGFDSDLVGYFYAKDLLTLDQFLEKSNYYRGWGFYRKELKPGMLSEYQMKKIVDVPDLTDEEVAPLDEEKWQREADHAVFLEMQMQIGDIQELGRLLTDNRRLKNLTTEKRALIIESLKRLNEQF